MYVTGYDGPPPGEVRFGVTRAARSRFAEPGAIGAADRERLSRYVGDMLAPYGIAYRPAETGFSYGDLAAAVLADVLAPGEEIDLLVLAYAVPDVSPGRATATWLSHICPGNPFAIGICDRGSAIGFAGLRLVRDYTRSGVARRSVLIVVEQPELPYDPPARGRTPVAASAVALLCGDVTGGGAELTGLFDTRSTIVDGARVIASASLRGVPDEQPVTGVWWDLAEALGTGAGPLVVADHDPDLDLTSEARFLLRAPVPPVPAQRIATEEAVPVR